MNLFLDDVCWPPLRAAPTDHGEITVAVVEVAGHEFVEEDGRDGLLLHQRYGRHGCSTTLTCHWLTDIT